MMEADLLSKYSREEAIKLLQKYTAQEGDAESEKETVQEMKSGETQEGTANNIPIHRLYQSKA